MRRLQYFYRHTRVAGASFDYHGKPIAILKGRIIASGLLACYYVAGTISPTFRIVALGLVALVLPWLLARSFRFRFHNSSYRGIRFAFSGSTRSAYWVFLGLPALSMFTLFTLVPFWHQRMKRYQHANATYGQTRFTYDAPVSGFYSTYVVAALLSLGFLIGFGVATFAMVSQVPRTPVSGSMQRASALVPLLMLVVFYWMGVFGVRSFVNARVQNLVWRHTRLGPHAFDSDVMAVRLFYLTVTNLIGTVATLGLFQPFGQVRLAQYVTSRFSLVPAGRLDDVVAGDEPDIAATGEEAAALFDIDIAL